MKETHQLRTAARGRIASLLASALIACGVMPASGQVIEAGTVAPELSSLRRTTVAATVITLPSGIAYGSRVREMDMPKFGCTFEVTEYGQLAALFDVLEHAEMRPSGLPPRPLDFRFSIVLKNRDGAQTKMLFRDLVKKDGTVEGIAGGTAVFVNGRFPGALRAWASGLKPVTLGTDGVCV